MKSYRKGLWFNVPERRVSLNITPQVKECLRESGTQKGLYLANAMHITASVHINDDGRDLLADYEATLEELAPHEPLSCYLHDRTGEDNADAHSKRQTMGRSRRHHERPFGLGLVGADRLRRVRRPAPEAGAGRDHCRVSTNAALGGGA